MIMVNQKENLVIVQWSTWPQAEPSFSAQPLEASLMFSAIANACANAHSQALPGFSSARCHKTAISAT